MGQTITPAANTIDGVVIASMCRGSVSSTDTGAHTVIAAGGAQTAIYVTSLQFGNSSSTSVTVTLNDTVSSKFVVPASSTAFGGSNVLGRVPLLVAENTALTMTSSSGQTTVTCNAQGFYGP